MAQKFIVAEITKNWSRETPVSNLLCEQFEKVINVNDERSYKLIDWKMMTAHHGDNLVETIIAIFELEKREPKGSFKIG